MQQKTLQKSDCNTNQKFNIHTLPNYIQPYTCDIDGEC